MKFSFIKPSSEIEYTFDPESILLGYQKRWIADEAKFKVSEKGRRTGFTWGEAADASLVGSLSREAGGSDHFYIGSNREMAEEFIDAVAGWAQVYSYACSAIEEGEIDRDGKYFEDVDGNKINTFTIYFESGYKVHALSSRPSNLRGRQGNVTIDEGAFHDDLKAVLQAAIPLMAWGGKIRVISTHNTVSNDYYEIVEDIKKGVRKGTLHKLTLDDARKEGLFKRICQIKGIKWTEELEDEWTNDLVGVLDEDSVKEEFYCVPKESSGSYIPLHLLTRAAKPEHRVIRIQAPQNFMDISEVERRSFIDEWLEGTLKTYFNLLKEDERHSLGIDIARLGDLSSYSICGIAQDTTRRMRLIVEARNMPFNQQEQIMTWIARNVPRLIGIAGDKTGIGAQLMEQMTISFGSSMVAEVQLTNKYYDENMPKYKGVYESGYIEIPLDEEVIQDHRKITVINGIPKIEKGKDKSAHGGERHGDSAVSSFLAYIASMMEGGVIEFTELSRHNSDWDSDEWDDNDYERGCF